ncbi:MAG: PCRF domain-containing protein, partial [Isosphaeraceae bacterium]
MFEKLQADYQRFLEIERLLLDPEVTANVARVTALAKERGTLAKVAVAYGRYLELGRQIAEAESLFATEIDPEMRSYAVGELEGLRKQHAAEGEALRDVIYDRQAGADHAALIMEIRAGTGGDEAALFARDL